MRIIVHTPTFLPAIGGAEMAILEIFRRLARDHSVLVLTPYPSESIVKNNCSVIYDHLINFKVQRYKDSFSFFNLRGHRLTKGLIPPFSLSAVSAIKRAIMNFKPDVVNVHYVVPTGLAALYAQKFAKIPTIITYIGRDVPGPGVPKFWKYWHKFVGFNCVDMTFVSKYCRDVIYGADSEFGHVVYVGVGEPKNVVESEKSALRLKWKLNKGDNIIFSLQRLDYLKRVDTIIESLPKILRIKRNTRLIIGGTGPDLPRLKKRVSELGLDQDVIFTEFISNDELPAYFSIADLFVFHSTYETFGIVLAEAMNYSKAIVSVNNTAVREVVDNNKTGILVRTQSSSDIANAVIDLLNDDSKRLHMGYEGKRKAKELFQWDVIASRYEMIFKSALSNN